MDKLFKGLAWFVAIEHFGFLILEMFLYKGIVLKKLSDPENIEGDKLILFESLHQFAINQGLYNGFLAAGIIWGLVHKNKEFSSQIIHFFLICVLIAGIYGAITVKPFIFFIQALPALLCLSIYRLKRA